jgi:hypothetical protein
MPRLEQAQRPAYSASALKAAWQIQQHLSAHPSPPSPQREQYPMPDIQLNLFAIALAVVVNFFLGYVWYTPLFGKRWLQAVGLPAGHSAQGSELAKGLLGNLLGCTLIAFVLANNMAVWTPSTWGVQAAGPSAISQALQAAGFTWLGFFLPPLLNGVLWERRSWALLAINGGYYFVSLLLAAMLLTHLH